MRVHSLRLRSFRAHDDSRLEFAPKINLIHGPNGAGKTNILEAVHYLCLSKSFLTASDRLALRKEAPFFELTAAFGGRRRRAVEVRLHYDPKGGKHIFTNGARVERVADMVGMLPVVSFAPGDIAITAGAPAERRRFMDNILCQARPAYLEQLMRYRRVLRQRNEMLTTARRRRQKPAPAALASWDAALVEHGSRLIAARVEFLADFASFLQQAYQHLATIEERPAMTYRGIASLDADAGAESIRDAFRRRLSRVADRERTLGRTQVGPHRDEVRLTIDGFLLREYGSQGQHRTFGIAIKLAQYLYLQNRLEEEPILLLDDVFDSLDAVRAQAFLSLLQSDLIGQSLITAAQKETVSRFVPFADADHRRVQIRGGKVAEE